MTQNSPPSEKKKSSWIMIGCLILMIIIVCVITAISLIFGVRYFRERDQTLFTQTRPNQPQGESLILVATPGGLSAYMINIDQDRPVLPAGSYYAEMKTADGWLWSCAHVIALDDGNGFGQVDFSAQNCQSRSSDSQDLETLVRFLISVDLVRLTYLDIVSNNFSEPLYPPVFHERWMEELSLLIMLDNLGDQEEIMQAARNFISKADFSQSSAKSISSFAKLNPNPITKIASFFGIRSEENEQARQDILSVYPHLSYEEKQEAYEALPPDIQRDHSNFDDFVQKVEQDKINGLMFVRRELMNSGPYAGIWQSINPNSNRPSGEIIHRVGGKSLQRGAELYVAVGKGVLSAQFAGIDTGFGYFEKANKWAEYVRGLYVDPKNTLTSEARNQVESALSDYIKSAIQAHFPDLGEMIAEDLAERIKDRMVTGVVDITDVLVQDTETGELLPEVAPGYEITSLDDFEESEPGASQPEPEVNESVPPEPEPTEEGDPFIEARYVGTFTDTLLIDGCMVSGYFELLLYSDNQASIGTKSIENSCGESVYSELHFTDPKQGSHGAGIFTITLREGFDLIGQYDETSFSGSMQDALFLFLCSGEWVP